MNRITESWILSASVFLLAFAEKTCYSNKYKDGLIIKNTIMNEQVNKLYRSRTDRIFFGVCGGLAKHFNIDSTLFRILFVLLTFANGAGLILYIALAMIVPNEPGPEVAIDRGEKIKEFADEVGEKARKMAAEVKIENGREGDLRNILGITIVIIGLVILLQRIAPHFFSWLNWGLIWPMLIILFGAYLTFVKK